MLKLKLVDGGKHKIQVIKLIRLFTGLGLKESKYLLDNAPSILISNTEDISIDQIIKNFNAIGAVVERFNEEAPPKDNIAGSDDAAVIEKPGIAKKETKLYKKSDSKKTTYKKPQFTSTSNVSEKLKLKPAIVFAITIAVIKSFTTIYFGFYAFFFVIFIVAVGIAYFLRKHNVNTEKKLGVPAFLITLLYFFSNIIADWIVLFVLYQYEIHFNIMGIIVSLFTSWNILVIVAATLSYFLTINKNIFKQFLPENKYAQKKDKNLVENKQKRYHKEKKRF